MNERSLQKRLLVGLILILAVIPAALFANGKGEASKAGKTEITFWAHRNGAFNRSYQGLAEQYMKDHPEVYINFSEFEYETYIQTLQTAFPAGEASDIIQMFGTWVRSYSDRLAEVPAALMTPDQAGERIFAATLGGYLFAGKLWGVPQEFNCEYGAALVNTALAEEAGLADISSGWTGWDKLIADAQKMVVLRDGAMTRAGLSFTHRDGIGYMFLSLLRQYGGSVMNETGTAFTFDTEAGRKALKFMKRLVEQGLTDPLLYTDEQNWVGEAYFEGLAAMAVCGPWVVADFKDDYPDVAQSSDYIALPPVNGSRAFSAASGWGLVVSENAKQPELAWDLVKFITLDPDKAMSFSVGSGTLPALKENASGVRVSELLADYPYMKTHLGILEHGLYQGHMPDSDLVIYDIIYNNVLLMLQGQQSLEDSLNKIQAASQDTMGKS